MQFYRISGSSMVTFLFVAMIVIMQGCGGGGGNEAVSGDSGQGTGDVEVTPETPSENPPGGTPPVVDEDDQAEPPPSTDTAADKANSIDTAADKIADEILASGSGLDLAELSRRLMTVAGVEQAIPNTAGDSIYVKQDDGQFFNYLPVLASDEDLFEQVEAAPQSVGSLRAQSTVNPIDRGVFRLKSVVANQQALILAPFNATGFGGNLAKVRNSLEGAGYEVTTFVDQEVGLEQLRATYLQKFGVIYFVTHGGTGPTPTSGDLTFLSLSIEQHSARGQAMLNALSDTEKAAIVFTKSGRFAGSRRHLAITPQWLLATSQDEQGQAEFGNSLFIAGACSSAKIDVGSGSMAATVFSLGGGGYVGFDNLVTRSLVFSLFEETLIPQLASGASLAQASDRARADLTFANITFAIPGLFIPPVSVRSMDDAQRLPNEPLYIVPSAAEPDPDQGDVGEIEIFPGSGAPGTRIRLTFRAYSSYVQRVAVVRYQIGESGSQGILTRTAEDASVWRSELLEMPASDQYPRPVPFNFEIVDDSGTVFGRSTLEFTLTRP